MFFYMRGLIINDVANVVSYQANLIGILNLINIVLFGMFYFALHNIKLDRDLIYKTFGFIAVFQSVYIILQHFQLDQFFHNISYLSNTNPVRMCWPVGLWGNEALVSWCIALCAPYLLAYKQLRFKVGYGLCGIAILLTKCSAGIAGFILGYIFWLFFNKKRYSRLLAVTLIIVILSVGGLGYTSGKLAEYFNPTHRFQVWKKTIELGKQHGITGWGIGSYRQLFFRQAPEFQDDGHWAQAHNDYVQLFYEQGIIGVGIIVSLLWIAFLQFWRKRKGLIPMTSLVALSIIAFFGFPLHTAMGVLVIVSLVLYERDI
uniref:Putative O-antigen ligase n=1 Tax=viral metagenome TaxID=1070528 RepID=A0A6M3L1S2_9ZZZZ